MIKIIYLKMGHDVSMSSDIFRCEGKDWDREEGSLRRGGGGRGRRGIRERRREERGRKE